MLHDVFIHHTEASKLHSMPMCQFFQDPFILLRVYPPSMVSVVTNWYAELNLREGILSLPETMFVGKC